MKRIITVAIVICMCFCFLSACLPNSTQLNEDGLGVGELSNKEKVTESTQSESGLLIEDSGEVFIDESEEFYSFIDEDNIRRINDTYLNYLKTERGRNKTEIDLLSFMESFSADSLTDMEDGYLLSAEVGGVLVFDQGVVMDEDDLLRYHISRRPYLSVSDIGIYESYDQMKQMDFHKQYKLHCLKYTKEDTPIYVIDEDVTHMYYFVYFSVNGNWFRVTSPGYRYPSSECILRNSDEWGEFSFPERNKKQFEAIRELTDISNQHSILVKALKNTEKGATQASDNSVSNAHEQGDTDLDSKSFEKDKDSTDPEYEESGHLDDTSYDGEIILDGNEPYASIIEDYEEFMETKANGKRVLKIGYLEDQLPITSFCKMGDSYEIGGLTIYDEGVINGEEDLLRYHASLIGASGPEVIGIYDSDEKLSVLNFNDQYRIYCRTYIKESIKIYAMSYFVIPYDDYIGYDLYFCINGVWMKLNANGYYYPGANGILRTPNEWPEGIKYVTDALIELSDVSNDDSSLILALKLALS